MKKLLSEYPELLREWHPTKNGDLRPEEFTYVSKKKVWWVCHKGHDYDTIITSRTMKVNPLVVLFVVEENQLKKII